MSAVSDTTSIVHVSELTKIFKVPEREAGLRAAARSLVRRHWREVRAVDAISFDIAPGEVVGFLGPNGAGKTTTIKVLTTLVHPTSGTVKIFDRDIVRHSREIRKRVGVVLQEPSFEANLTVERALELYGLMWGVPAGKAARQGEGIGRQI